MRTNPSLKFIPVGSVCGQGIADHPDVRKLGFTGSTPVGKTIMTSCAQSNLKKVSLELGGKSPLIIFADCDLSKAVRMVTVNFVFFFSFDYSCFNALLNCSRVLYLLYILYIIIYCDMLIISVMRVV